MGAFEHGEPEDGDLVQSAPECPIPDEVRDAIRTLIRWAGDDPDREGVLGTPERVVRAYEEFFAGYADRVSGRAVASGGKTWLRCWLLSYYDPQNVFHMNQNIKP